MRQAGDASSAALDRLMQERLEAIRAQGRYRRVRRIESASAPTVMLEGRTVLLMSTNNYLGLANDPRLKEAAMAAIERYGAGSGGARLTTGNFDLHEAVEEAISRLKGTGAALLFSSGYMANIGTIAALAQHGDLIFSDALNHASLIDGCRMSRARTVVYRHADTDHLAQLLQSEPCSGRRWIVTDGVFSMDGDIAPLRRIVELAKAFGAFVVVDDAHGTGVLGRRGAGTVEHLGLEGEVHVQIGTLSKAIGAEGGFVAASRSVIDYLRNTARSYIFSTSLSPGVLGSALAALTIIPQEPERRAQLQANQQRLREGLARLGYRLIAGETPIVAVVIGSAEAAVRFSQGLEERGLYAPAIRPPTVPEGTSRIRMTVMATHTRTDIERALTIFEEMKRVEEWKR